ncbi:uncharacterized protein LOC111918661 [Lactuca sativa]|uniref:Uncharacterized protein n=1 Tax=Lactuca sativa TaxID=4236 RepID=A0A9R1VHT5_LACSA|nr:uncharacterized protein LOC111918661 [Lactuca sativa]KAJ0204956.1 hypothetical protein LSAT_V11C500272650 [Lactuca sativa]
MFVLFIFIVIFTIVIISINKKTWIDKQAPAIIKKDTSEPVFESLNTQDSSGEDMSKPPPKQPKIDLNELSLEDDMNNARIEALSSNPSSPRARKSSAMKISCLCAPTNHPGSFRCRYHRNSVSVGSNLSELAYRKTASVGANLSDLGNTTTNMKKSRRPREC